MHALLLLALVVASAGCAAERRTAEREAIPPMPDPPRAFRAAWIATVANIDWPSRPGLPVEQQQAELRALLDRAVLLRLNAVILQVRPAADALYASDLEPWSPYLTGTMGRAPEPYYDPLAFAVAEAHRRGLQLHAWFNPFRARHPSYSGPVPATHISRQRPELVRRYGNQRWLDPGEPEARAHALAVMLDVVRRYDVDGVHIDDYFYPYPIQDSTGREIPFPDSASWARAQQEGVTRSRDDWRRRNVDLFVEALYAEVRRLRPDVLVGISPFGIWRPGHPEQIRGFDAYARLYADARTWLQQGWLDYLSPQLYWPIDQHAQSFPALLDWWAGQNARQRHLWPGLFTSRVITPERLWQPEEIAAQVDLVQRHAGAGGHIHFSMKALVQSAPLADLLAGTLYEGPALVPPTPWLDGTPPGAPQVAVAHIGDRPVLQIVPPSGEPVWQWVVRTRYGERWQVDILPGWKVAFPLELRAGTYPQAVAVSAVDRLGNEGPVVQLHQQTP